MRIVNIVPGFGGSFYCGNCLRDSSYVKSLIDEGHDAITIPIYLPLSLDAETKPDIPVFYGAVAIYMKQQFKIFRKMPKWLENFFNAPFMLRYAAKKAGSTRAEGLEEMTLSMLRGHEGYQKEELQQLIDFLKKEIKPDVVHLSNALLMGLAAKIKLDLGIPVVCSLQDEDVWIDAMSADYQDQLWGLFTEKARDIDAFVAVSRYYGEVMQKRMSIAPEKLHVIYIGLDVNNYDYAVPDTDNPVIGYMSRMNAENGFEVFMDAFIKLKSNPKYKNVKARVSGGQTGDDKKFVHKQLRKLKKNNLLNEVKFVKEYEEKYHNCYNQHIDLLSVPVLKGEAFGLYQIEALACGVPTVQPALGVFPEIAEVSQGGLIYEPNTPEALARKWEELLADPEKMLKLSEQGRKSVEKIFNTKRTTRKILEVYQSLVGDFKTQTMTEIQAKIEEIRLLLNNRIEHFEYSKKVVMPFKVHSFIEIMNLRMLDFCEAANLLINSNHITPSLTLIRALFENVAVVYRISSSIDKSLKSNELTENFDDLITRISFGTRYDSDLSAINIMTNIEKLDKEYNGIKKFYDDLSEFVHPNWDGVKGSYSELCEGGRYTDVFKVFTLEHPLFKWFESCFLLCMSIYIDYSQNIKVKLPSFFVLSESEIAKNK